MPTIEADAHSISVFAPGKPEAVAIIRNTSMDSGAVQCFTPGGGLATVAVLMLLELFSKHAAFSFSAERCPFVGSSAAVARHEETDCDFRIVTCTARKHGCKFEAPGFIARLMSGDKSVMDSHVCSCVYLHMRPSFELEEQSLVSAREKEAYTRVLYDDIFDKYARSLQKLKAVYRSQPCLSRRPRCANWRCLPTLRELALPADALLRLEFGIFRGSESTNS
jgi:hypothetical protein